LFFTFLDPYPLSPIQRRPATFNKVFFLPTGLAFRKLLSFHHPFSQRSQAIPIHVL
jgi:hypothetical protein